jgi:hypothetical protein
MLSIREAKDRAVERAIDSGVLPNIDLIHQVQRFEGVVPCFGRLDHVCSNTSCAWYGQCMALLGEPREAVAAR